MSNQNIVSEYDRRLKDIPKINKEIEEEIRKFESLVEDQSTFYPIKIMKSICRILRSKQCKIR